MTREPVGGRGTNRNPKTGKWHVNGPPVARRYDVVASDRESRDPTVLLDVAEENSYTADNIIFALSYPDWHQQGWNSDNIRLAWIMSGYDEHEIIEGKPPLEWRWEKWDAFIATKAFNTDLLSDMNLPWNNFPPPGLTDLESMFANADYFNEDITGWDTSRVVTMKYLFDCAFRFNRDISGWDTSNVENMLGMLRHTEVFNWDISRWDVSRVVNMSRMLEEAKSFDQNLGSWDISNVRRMWKMFSGSGMSKKNLSDTFVGWAKTAQKKGVKKGVELGGLPYRLETLSPEGQAAIKYLEEEFDWKFYE